MPHRALLLRRAQRSSGTFTSCRRYASRPRFLVSMDVLFFAPKRAYEGGTGIRSISHKYKHFSERLLFFVNWTAGSLGHRGILLRRDAYLSLGPPLRVNRLRFLFDPWWHRECIAAITCRSQLERIDKQI
jgi:hypothetical protein